MIIWVSFGVIAAVIFLQRLIYIKFAFTNLTFNYYFSRTEVNEGDIFFITEEIENKKYLPLPAVSTILEAGDCLNFSDNNGNIIEQKNAFCFYTIGIYKKIVRTWIVKATKRGRVNIDNITVNIKDVFGLVSVAKDFSCNSSVLVLPSAYNKNETVEFADSAGGTHAVPAGYYSDPFNIMKISQYTYSEPLNKINWKASAKSQFLMVNDEQPAISDRILVALDVSEKYQMEKNIKICATLLKMLPEDCEVKFISNALLPENYANVLLKESAESNGFIQTREFNFNGHGKNYRRVLAEIVGSAGSDIDKSIEKFKKPGFYNTIITVKGGKIHETGKTIFF